VSSSGWLLETPAQRGQHLITIDIENSPQLQFRIDNFCVPDAARPEFDAAARRNRAFIKTLPGFLGHLVFEKREGPTAFNIATIAIWQSKEAMDRAAAEVRAYYERIGFNMQSEIAKWGVKAEIGTYTAPPQLQ
jgi:hypothetical protein